MENDKVNENRRGFLKSASALMGLGLCGCVVSSILTACDKDEEVDAPSAPTGDYPYLKIAEIPALSAVGGLYKTKNAFDKNGAAVTLSDSVIIFRMETNKFVVLNSVCLHAGAPVNISGGTQLICVAHSAEFNKESGAVLSNGTASGVPPLTVIGNTYDAASNKLTLKM